MRLWTTEAAFATSAFVSGAAAGAEGFFSTFSPIAGILATAEAFAAPDVHSAPPSESSVAVEVREDTAAPARPGGGGRRPAAGTPGRMFRARIVSFRPD